MSDQPVVYKARRNEIIDSTGRKIAVVVPAGVLPLLDAISLIRRRKVA